MTLFSISLILFLIMDPVGSVGAFLTMVKDLPKARQRYIIIREMLIALAIMIFFNFVGEGIFMVLDISEKTVRIASGLILLLVAIKILFSAPDNPRANLPKGEPFIVPLAVPLIAGPSTIATIMLFASIVPGVTTMMLAIFFAWAATVIVFFAAPVLQKTLGVSGLTACERLMGMVLALLGVQRLLEGIQLFVNTPR